MTSYKSTRSVSRTIMKVTKDNSQALYQNDCNNIDTIHGTIYSDSLSQDKISFQSVNEIDHSIGLNPSNLKQRIETIRTCKDEGMASPQNDVCTIYGNPGVILCDNMLSQSTNYARQVCDEY